MDQSADHTPSKMENMSFNEQEILKANDDAFKSLYESNSNTLIIIIILILL